MRFNKYFWRVRVYKRRDAVCIIVSLPQKPYYYYPLMKRDELEIIEFRGRRVGRRKKNTKMT